MSNLPTELFGDVLVIHTPDELSDDQINRFVRFVDEREQRKIVLDMNLTELVDSEGLTAILDCQNKVRERHGDLKIASTHTINRKILEMTRLDEQLEVYDSVVDAVNSYH